MSAAAPSPTKAALSGLEPLALDGRFVHIGERTNVAGSAKFKRLVKEGKWDDALSIARTQIADGADVIDVCMDDGMIDGVEAMTTFLRLIASEPDIARVPVMIDSSDWAVLCAGLACVQGKAIVNSISLKEGEAVFLNRARHIRKMGAAAVVMLFDEEGQADTYARKVAVARRAYKLLTADGFPAGDIIFDPNVLAVATGIAAHASYGKAFIEACRTIRNEMPDVHLSGGISNLSFAFRGNNALRQAMHAVFLHHATAAGLDMSILNPAQRMDYATIEPALRKAVEDAVLDTDPEAAERLLAFATTAAPAAPVAPVAPAASAASVASVATVASATSVAPAAPAASATTVASVAPVAPAAPLAERISRALTTGNTSQIAADALEAYQELGSAMAVIDTYLMPAMEQVGELFGAGKMFLPQVVKSARVMKEAVAALSPFMAAASESEGETRPLVMLATVRGDVHDIGKHIAAVVMQCNGFRVEDLGVMVEPAAIADAAERMGACCVGLSGLITPSLTEMERTVAELERRGLNVPVMVGGATTSPLHTALKIAPAYPSGAVFHCRAAADNPSVLRHLVSAHSAEYIAAHKAEQAAQREAYYRSEAERKPLLTLTEAQRRKRIKPLSKVVVPTAEACRPIWWDSDESLGDTSPQSTLLSHINWRAFYTAWGIKPTIADTAPEVIKLRADAERLLAQFLNKRLLRLQVFAQVLPAVSEGDSMLITAPGGKIHRFALPRTLYDEPTTRCMADLLLAKNEGIPHASSPTDYVCPFLCSSGVGLAQLQAQFRSQGDDYHAILAKLLADRLAEALAEMLQAHLRDKLRWGKHHQRLAIGYPACPDHSQKQQVMDILSINPQASGLSLTESHMITPAEAVCGFIFAINN